MSRPLSLAFLLFAFAASGCARPSDPRFASPRATLRTLFDAYGVGSASEADLRARLVAHESFHLRDGAAFHACFSDYARDEDEGAAGFVFGRLIAVKDHLVFHTDGDHATVRAAADALRIPTVHLHRRNGAFTISLRESVPVEVRSQLRAVYRRQRERLERQGLGSN